MTKVLGSLDEFTPFFGGDQKGPQMVHALFDGTNYTDRSKEPSPLLKQLLRAENYNRFQTYRNNATGQSMLPEDVHHNVTDFVVSAALFARAIDKPSGASNSYSEMYRKMQASLKTFLDSVYDPRNMADMNSIVGAPARQINSVYYSQELLRTGNKVDRLYLLGMADLAAYEARSSFNTDRLNSITIIELGKINNCSSGSNNICIASAFTNTVDNLAGFVATSGSGVTVDVIRSNIQRAIQLALEKLTLQMKNDIKAKYGNTITTIGRSVGQFNKDTVIDFMNDIVVADYRNLLNNNIKFEVEKVLNELVALKSNIPRTRLDDASAQNFAENVFRKWPEMGSEARNFYRQNIAMFAEKKSSAWRRDIGNRGQLGWVRLTDDEIENAYTNSVNPAELRVNLLKRQEGEGAGKVLFGTNLPDIPAKANVWYSQQNGLFGVVQNPGVDFLRKLYEQVYASGTIGPLGLINVELNLANRSKGPFELNMAKFTTNYLNSKETKVHTSSSHDYNESDLFADYQIVKGIHAVDMAYNRTWTFDSQRGEYYRMENGRKVWYDEQAKGDTSTCYASYLGGKTEGGCKRVIECLFDGKPETLSRCMDVLETADMWTVAKEDALKVGPEMVRAVLSRFGVKARFTPDANGNSVKVPMPYEEWMRDIVGKEFPDNIRETIRKNTKLTDYIKGLINTCRANPSILNRDNPNVVAREDTPQFAKDLSLHKYLLPEVNSNNLLRIFSGSLENATMPRAVNNDLWNVFLSGSMSNVGFFSPYADQYSNIMGGGFYNQQGGHGLLAVTPALPSTGASNMNLARNSRNARNAGSSNMFRSMFAVLTRAMADVGVQIHSEDQQRINAAINKINQYEKELGLLCDILQSIVKLARFHGISLENIDKDNVRVVKLANLNDFEDVRDFVRCYVRDITRNMANNMSIQQYTGYELMNKLGPRYCNSVSGDSNNEKCGQYSESKDLVPL